MWLTFALTQSLHEFFTFITLELQEMCKCVNIAQIIQYIVLFVFIAVFGYA